MIEQRNAWLLDIAETMADEMEETTCEKRKARISERFRVILAELEKSCDEVKNERAKNSDS
jgi:hypothetical protein